MHAHTYTNTCTHKPSREWARQPVLSTQNADGRTLSVTAMYCNTVLLSTWLQNIRSFTGSHTCNQVLRSRGTMYSSGGPGNFAHYYSRFCAQTLWSMRCACICTNTHTARARMYVFAVEIFSNNFRMPMDPRTWFIAHMLSIFFPKHVAAENLRSLVSLLPAAVYLEKEVQNIPGMD